MDFGQLRSDELDEFLTMHNWNIPESRADKINQGQELFSTLVNDPSARFTYPVTDLYIASNYLGSRDKTYYVDEIQNLSMDEIRLFSDIFGLNQNDSPDLNRDRMLRILDFLGILISAKQVLGDPIIGEQLCEELTFKDAVNLWYATRIDLDCPIQVHDKDGHIQALNRLNRDTIKVGQMIEQLGSNEVRRRAVVSNLDDVARVLVESGMNPDQHDKPIYNSPYKQPKGSLITLLQAAVKDNNYELSKFLLDRGANPNHKKPKYILPLNESVKRGNLDIMKLLIEYGANINGYDNHYFTPVMTAAKYNQLEALDYLLELNPDINYKTSVKDTALKEAIKQGNVEIVKRLIDRGVELVGGEVGNVITATWAASIPNENMDEILLMLLQHGVGDVTPYDYILEKATNRKLYRSIQWILDNVEMDSEGLNKSLAEAAQNGNIELVKTLLDMGADPNFEHKSGFSSYTLPLIMSSKHGWKGERSPLIRELINQGADPNKVGRRKISALMELLSKWKMFDNQDILESTKILLDAGANPNLQDNKGNTALIHLFMSRDLSDNKNIFKTVKLLLERGADPQIQNDNEESALKLARDVQNRPNPPWKIDKLVELLEQY